MPGTVEAAVQSPGRLFFQHSWPERVRNAVWQMRRRRMASYQSAILRQLSAFVRDVTPEAVDNLRDQWAGASTEVDSLVLFDPDYWTEAIYGRFRAAAVESVVAGGRLACEETAPGAPFVLSSDDLTWVSDLAEGLSDREVRSIDLMIRNSLCSSLEREADLDGAVADLREHIRSFAGGSRQSGIALTETTRTFNYGIQQGYRGVGLRDKAWLTSRRPNVRDSHRVMDGQVAPIDGYFISGLGNRLEYPGDPRAPIEDTINCYCVLIAAT